jgi:hypothetical protein
MQMSDERQQHVSHPRTGRWLTRNDAHDGEMMKDGKTMTAMMQMMQQGGMMSKECMQSA